MSIVTLSATGVPDAVIDGSADARGMILRGLSGWLGTPAAKVDLTERLVGDGAHDVQDAQVLYSARTVTIEYRGSSPRLRGTPAVFCPRRAR